MFITHTINQIRMDFEKRRVDRVILQNLYRAYNPAVKDVDLFVQRAKALFPCLNCGLATLYLRGVLQKGVVVNGTYKSYNHTFLLLENTIIDITADQYGGPPIYIGPIQTPWDFSIRKAITAK